MKIAPIYLLALLLLVACAEQPQPKILTPHDAVAQLYSEIAGAYTAAINANTPTAPGAKPLISNDRYRQILGQLDAIKARIDQLKVALDVGRWNSTDPQSIADALRVIRATIPGG